MSPSIIGPMPERAAPTPLHLLGNFSETFTGAERELPDLAQALEGRRPCILWSVAAVHPSYAAQGVRVIDPAAGDVPRGGMLLLGGVHVGIGDWIREARPERIAVRYNLPLHERVCRMVAYLHDATGVPPEVLFASDVLRQSVGLVGRFEPSLIRIEPFLATPLHRSAGRLFTVGRMSRDVLEKHHPDDVGLYRLLAARGVSIRIMGGTCLAPWLAGVPGIELLPTGAMPAADFCAGLDAFFYRTGSFNEPYGRVVFEAMASALPVVAGAGGGYATHVRDGEEVFLVATQEQAVDALLRLQGDGALRERVARAAREAAIALHGDAAIEAMLAFYLR